MKRNVEQKFATPKYVIWLEVYFKGGALKIDWILLLIFIKSAKLLSVLVLS